MGACNAKPPVLSNGLCRHMIKFSPPKTFMLDVINEDILAFEKLRQRILAVKKMNAIPQFDVALFLSMSKQCRRLLTLYTEGIGGSGKAADMFRTLISRAHYRFRDHFGGFSQMVSHVVLNQVDFCVSIVPRAKAHDDDDSSSSDDEEDDKKRRKTRKNKKVVKKPKMLRYMFTPGAVFKSPDQSFHKNEVRLAGGRFTFMKGGAEEAKPRDEGYCNDKTFNLWLVTARSIKVALEIPEGKEAVDVYGGCLMQFEGV